MELHPEIVKKDGESEFVLLPYEEFKALQELLTDYEDLLDLRAAKREHQGGPVIPLSEVEHEFGL